ncbi:MAG: ABC transporter ATP-binding protein [Candidatus Sumerlaeaceae bacterium]
MSAVIETKDLTKLYAPGRGIDRLNLSIKAGEILGFLGPNGAGKTTTIRLMLGLVRPSHGSVRLFGERSGAGAASVRARIGYLPGELGLNESYTGMATLRFYQHLSGGNAPLREWLCKQLQLTPEDLRRRVKYYSKGMKQKIGIVQALQHEPELVILDEPTSGLDPLVQAGLFEVLREMRDRGRTVFFCSHVLSEVQRLCDRVGVVREGKLVLDSTLPDLAAGADRLLWVKLATNTDSETQEIGAGQVPAIARARFLRTEAGGWLVYYASPADAPRVLQELAQLKPVDFRFEPAFEESFLKLYGVHLA